MPMAAMQVEHEVLAALDPELQALRQEIDRLRWEGTEPPPDAGDSEPQTR
jgi:hypothetical protein